MGLHNWPALDMKSLSDIPYDEDGRGGCIRVKTEDDGLLEPRSMSPTIAPSTRPKRVRETMSLLAVSSGGAASPATGAAETDDSEDAHVDDAAASDALSDVTHQAEVSQWNKHMSKCNKRAKAMQALFRSVIDRAEEGATAHSNSPPTHPPTHRHHRRRRP